MYLKLDHPPVRYENYVSLIDPQLAANLDAVRSEMGNQRVLHLNSTATGGGVAEVLQSMVPLSNSLGIETERIVINPPYPEFFQATKKIHNLLQGAEGSLTGEEWEVYFRSIKEVARAMKRDGLKADVWVLHDPQLLPLAQFLREQDGSTWLWVCHIDLTTPNDSVLDTLLPLTGHFDHLVFSLQDYVPDGPGQPDASVHRTASHRPPQRKEHSHARGFGPEHRVGYGDRPQPAPHLPSVALRPVEGPLGGGRRLPDRQ